jgi:arylsulfatase A-like enzyme
VRKFAQWLVPQWTFVKKPAATVTNEFLTWLSGRDQRPFLAFLNYMDAHVSYHSVPPFSELFPEAPVTVTRGRIEGISVDDLEGMVAAYDRAIANLDHEMGRLFEGLRERGLLDQTLLIITSDHGEQFGEHGLQAHSNSLYMQVLRVPLIMVYPGHVPSSKRVSAPVSIRDIPATVFDLAELDNPGFAGMTLADRWRDSRDTPVTRRPQLAEVTCCSALAEPWEPVWAGDMKAVLDDEFHFIVRGDGTEELYNVSADPREENNLVFLAEHTDRVARFRVLLDSLSVRRPTRPPGARP